MSRRKNHVSQAAEETANTVTERGAAVLEQALEALAPLLGTASERAEEARKHVSPYADNARIRIAPLADTAKERLAPILYVTLRGGAAPAHVLARLATRSRRTWCPSCWTCSTRRRTIPR